jgi:hypothetical protein
MGDIRKYITIVESAYALEESVDAIIDEIFMESAEQLDEGIIGDVKAKVGKWIEKARDKASDMLPALQKKYDEVIAQLSKADPDQAKEVEAEMDKQAKSDWKNNAGKLVAALAVATTLLATVGPAQAGDRGYAYQVQKYNSQFQPRGYNPAADPQMTDYGKTPYRGKYIPYDGPRQGRDRYPYQGRAPYYPNQGYYQSGQGNVAVDVLIGAALGVAIGSALHR